MAVFGPRWSTFLVFFSFLLASVLISAERSIKDEPSSLDGSKQPQSSYLAGVLSFLWQSDESGYQHVWPELKFGWQIVIGTIIGVFGAGCGSVGGVGGGGIFVPMLTLVIGFDPKTATAMSKCMIMGAAGSTVYHNLGRRHPTDDLPIIDYDLVLLIQPMLLLGISIGVTFNVIFPDWVITILLIILFLGTSTKAFFLGVEKWKTETALIKKEAAKRLDSAGRSGESDYETLLGGPSGTPQRGTMEIILSNIYWKELGLLVFVWAAFLALQIAKNYTTTCSTTFWILNLLQIPASAGVFVYEAIGLYTGRRKVASKRGGTSWDVKKLIMFCACGMFAGVVGGLLGIGGGFVMGPLFLEMGIPPEVSSATATFGMSFSSSMSVVEYYLLNRFPVPYALYFILVAIIAAFIGQYAITKLIAASGRSSLIIFVLSLTIFISAVSLGGVGISNMIGKLERGEYMGFDNLCKYGQGKLA